MDEIKAFDDLSNRQQRILKFMSTYMQDNGYPPTIREIGEATEINSTSVVNYNLNKLVEAGYLERSDRVSRGLRIVAPIPGMPSRRVKKAENAHIARVALVGHIAAGQPIELPEDIAHYPDDEDALELPMSMLNNLDPAEVFALTVRGDSMIDAMISEGDTVILRKQTHANNGEMVAVWLPERGETTLKFFYQEKEQIRLQPAHPTMDAIFVDPSNCEVRGKVLTVIRRLH